MHANGDIYDKAAHGTLHRIRVLRCGAGYVRRSGANCNTGCKAATALDAGSINVTHLSSVAKCFTSDVAMEVASHAVDIFGGNGYSKRHPVERFMRDAKVTQLYEGTNDIQRLIISRHVKKAAAGNSVT